jgi:uncharacterized protein (UPF0548 family)
VIEKQVAAASHLPSNVPPILSLDDGLDAGVHLPFGFAHDYSRSRVGQGPAAFEAAKRAFERWATFDIGWVRVANPQAPIALGQVVAMEAHTFGLWTLNMSKIMRTLDDANRFGFLYATTEMHVEQGEERFLLEFDTATGDVWYVLEAISRPRHALVRMSFPVARALQHRFARDSHRRMRDEVLSTTSH